MKLYLKTLTPLHIGTGDKIPNYEYYEVNSDVGKMLYPMDTDRFLKILKAIRPDNFEALRKEYIQRVIDAGKGVSLNENAKKVAKLFSELNPKFLKDYGLRKDFDYYLQTEENTGRTLRWRGKDYFDNVHRELTLPTGEPYIPGSSIKGAIRTALLYRVVKNAIQERGELYSEICGKLNAATTEAKEVVQKAGNNKKKKNAAITRLSKVLDDGLEQLILYAGTKNVSANRNPYSEERFDLLKFLRVGDARDEGLESPELRLCEAKVFNINANVAQPKNFSTYHEATPSEQWFAFKLVIDLDSMRNIYEFCLQHQNDNRSDWIDFEKKTGRLFPALSLEKLWKLNLKDRDAVAELEIEILNDVLQAVFDFHEAQYQEDQSWYSQYMKPNYPVAFEKPKICEGLLRPGFGAGFISKTIFLALNSDDTFRELLLAYRKTLSIGKVNVDTFPKTRKIIIDGNRNLPFNWLQVYTERPVELDARIEQAKQEAERKERERQEAERKRTEEAEKQKRKEQEANKPKTRRADLRVGCNVIVYVFSRKNSSNMEVQPLFAGNENNHPKINLAYNQYDSNDSEILKKMLVTRVAAIQKVGGINRVQSLEPLVEPFEFYEPT